MRTHPSPILLLPRRCVRLWEHVKAVTQREAHVFLIWSHLPKACCQPPSGYVCVCVCPCVRLYLFTCQWPGVVEGNVCVSASLALKEKLYFCTHMWARPCGAPLCSYSRSLHCGHIFFIWLWSLCVHTKQGLCRVRVPCYLLSAWKRAALRKLPLKEPFVSHLKRNLCIRCVTKEF